MKLDYDWIDMGLFERLQSLAEKYNTKGRFTHLYTGGQEVVLGYYTPVELDRIRKSTGLDIIPFKSKELV